jgi:hypothetical protein
MGVRGHGLVSKVLCLAAEIGRTRLNVPSVAKGGLLFGRIDSSQSSGPRWYDSTISTCNYCTFSRLLLQRSGWSLDFLSKEKEAE